MPAIVRKLGPGTVSIGDVGTEVDFSCQVTAAHVDWEADEGDEVTVLCGEVVPGARTYSANFAGTLLQDLHTGGIVDYSWDHKGEQVPFSFVPVDAPAGIEVAGTLILTPLSVGGDEAGQNMTSDFEWPIVGDPTLTPSAASSVAATRVNVKGAANLERTLKAAGADLADMKALHARVGDLVADGGRSRYNSRSGALEATIRSSGTAKAGVVRAGGGSVVYAGVQEFGWPARHIPAQGALTGSLADNEERIVGLYQDEVDKVLTQVKGQ